MFLSTKGILNTPWTFLKRSSSLCTGCICQLGCSLQGINALYFMDIKSCVSFTELGTVVLYLGVFVIGKNTPQLKISRVKWWNNIMFFNFSHFFLFFSIHLHNLPNYTIFSYLHSKFPSRNMCTEYQFRGKNDWIWVYPPIV